MNEYQVQALIEYVFRRNGAERPSFATIVGSGPNSTTLHYDADDRQIRAGDVVVMDIGASYKGYAADVTRTVPASGAYSPEQRQIYQIVRDAQAAAERQAKPGVSARAMSDSANAVLAAGLTRLGLIETPDATFDYSDRGTTRQLSQLFMYYMHDPAVERYKNVGVRIEDDYIVTDIGVEWISRAPREMAEIEAIMAKHITP